MPSVSIENYLKAIWHLEQEGHRVKTKALATELDVAQPSATNMLKTLEGLGYVDYAPYRGARLTSEGRQAALRVIRNHRLIEAFLVATLGYSWEEVHAEAERLEHAVSDTLIDRMDAFLGHPIADPHGDPIPTAEGILTPHDALPLLDAEAGQHVEIVRALDQSSDVLRYLAELGLIPGAQAEVLSLEPFDGPLRVRTDGEHAISRALAGRLLVRRVS